MAISLKCTTEQYTHEKLLNIICHQENEKQKQKSHNVVPLDTCWNA